ncbi:uncharacterized protein K452DRAFT_332247 [Aplosporella prunicola CBS 121167]|uniref:Uncharacterized protein n=1 Tax=Aplosporella prunicola CBS 121167 TaxID=1176127 RepID=A0A6A6BEA5_9PEZI|nr:uncharacterized protein K452DRAFT_332247 [Aplosporella prunicola CBS 121167]KAF2142502.1 hypothetical protein K452DRAFT_332247 [Aplosporella prunicola CBS 121167]
MASSAPALGDHNTNPRDMSKLTRSPPRLLRDYDNWNEWKALAIDYLAFLSLEMTIYGRGTVNEQSIACKLIKSRLSDKILKYTTHCESAQSLWGALHKLFHHGARELDAQMRLRSINRANYKNVDHFLLDFKAILTDFWKDGISVNSNGICLDIVLSIKNDFPEWATTQLKNWEIHGFEQELSYCDFIKEVLVMLHREREAITDIPSA